MADGAPLRKVWCHLQDSLTSPGWALRVTVAVTTSSFVFHSPCDCCKGTLLPVALGHSLHTEPKCAKWSLFCKTALEAD
jgi:hypothetical protein